MRPDDETTDIDRDIFARRIMAAIAKIQEADGCGFRDALHKVRARYDHLRLKSPDRLPGPVEYWDGMGKSLRPRRALVALQGGLAPTNVDVPPKVEVARERGERRIVVDDLVYYWRIPRRASGAQLDLARGVVAVVRRADGSGEKSFVEFPQARPDVDPKAPPVRPSDLAAAIRALVR